jgi:hypothetical protein
MGFAARRVACGCLIALGAAGLLPGSAGAAVTLGSTNLDPAITDFGAGCSTETCLFVQKRLPGAQVRAPFPGTIFNWNVVTPGPYSYQLVVLRKRRNGKFKDVGESHPGATPGAGAYEYPADLHVRKGDYIALRGNQVQGIFNARAKTMVFDPAVEFPDSRKPSFTSADEYQFNATMRRQRRH